jgi:hypothetical protein
MPEPLLDAAGRRRSPATLPEFHAGRSPRNKGMRYPADPPTIEEIVTVMRHAGDSIRGRRLRGLLVVLRRAKGGRRREVGMDDWRGSSSSRGFRRDHSRLGECRCACWCARAKRSPGSRR